MEHPQFILSKKREESISVQSLENTKYFNEHLFLKKHDLPYVMSSRTFFFVASFVSTSLSIDMVDMLSDLKIASPFLQ